MIPLHLFCSLLQKTKSKKTEIASIKQACSIKWGLYYPKPIFIICLLEKGFNFNFEDLDIHGHCSIEASIKKIDVHINNCMMWLPKYYSEWEGSSGYKLYPESYLIREEERKNRYKILDPTI